MKQAYLTTSVSSVGSINSLGDNLQCQCLGDNLPMSMFGRQSPNVNVWETISQCQCLEDNLPNVILIASRTSILGFNSTNIRCPSPVLSNGLPRESIGQTQPERNPSLLVHDAIRMTFYEKALEVSW